MCEGFGLKRSVWIDRYVVIRTIDLLSIIS